MNVVLWIVQGLLAAVFLLAGGLKVLQPIETLSKRMTFVSDVPSSFVRFIGASELLGVAGLLLPALTNILPWLTVFAAAGLGSVMLCALVLHTARREFTALPVVAVLLALAAFVAYGRGVLTPFS